MTILTQLPIVRLRFDLQALEPAAVPAHKGPMLRMALLWWLSEYLCPLDERCRHGCRLPSECLYGRICEPVFDPSWPSELQARMGRTPPPAYVLWDLHDRRTYLEAGAEWGFELVLIGELALNNLPAVVAAMQRGAEEGMIPDWQEGGQQRLPRLRSRVRRVALPATERGSSPPERRLCDEQVHNGRLELVWQDYSVKDVTLSYANALQWAQAWERPLRALSVRYLSPVRIREDGQPVEIPHFGPVVRQSVRRLRMLSVVHGAGEWPREEFGPLLDLAESVCLEHHETSYTGFVRRSKRAGSDVVEGFVGQAWYAAEDFRPLLPMLWLGQWLHIGKEYVLGNGRYALEMPAP
jgi:hypothetical protein